jgi:RNA polymerase sigma-70 factor (ECF subfamily)
MHQPDDREDDDLLRRAADDPAARDELLGRHREALRRMIAARLDRRLAPRADASDVAQEALEVAARRLREYLAGRPVPFAVWLRGLADERLKDLHRRHVAAQRRSVRREEPPLPDESALALAERLFARDTGPTTRLRRQELRKRVLAALAALAALRDADREVLVLRHLEELSWAEAAAVLGVGEGALRVRYLRAVQRFHKCFPDGFPEE